MEVDGAPVPLVLRGFPGQGELRALAATLSAAGLEHGQRVWLRFEARRSFPGATRVGLRAPPSLRPVLLTFVEPSTRQAAPGEAATFTVRAASAAARRAEVAPEGPARVVAATGAAAPPRPPQSPPPARHPNPTSGISAPQAEPRR